MKWYHGGNNQLYLNGYKDSHSAGTGLWLTNNKQTAIAYMRGPNPCVIEVEPINLHKTLTVDMCGKSYGKLPPTLPKEFTDCKTTDDVVRKAKMLGYDSVMFKNVRDMKNAVRGFTKDKFTFEEAAKPSTSLVLTKSGQIKIVNSFEPEDLPNVVREEFFPY